MNEENARVKKPWTAKKTWLTCTLVGVLVGLAVVALRAEEVYQDFERNYVNHTHNYRCSIWDVDYDGVKYCDYSWLGHIYTPERYVVKDTVIYEEYIPRFIITIAVFEVLAGGLVISKKLKKSKNEGKIKQEKINNTVNNVLD